MFTQSCFDFVFPFITPRAFLRTVPPAKGEGQNTGLIVLQRILLGSVKETYKKAREAEDMRRDRARAREEQIKVQQLLDSTIRDKRKVCVGEALSRPATYHRSKESMVRGA